MNQSGKHQERESLAAAIKGLDFDEHLHHKRSSPVRDPADQFAAWHERFRHELASEFGELPEDEDQEALDAYIKKMRKEFRLRLR